MLCCSESRDLPFLLKYLPLNGISSWRQWLNMKDKQVGMDKDGVSGAGHGWTPPAVVAVLQPCWVAQRLSQNNVPVPALTGQPGSLDRVPVLALCCCCPSTLETMAVQACVGCSPQAPSCPVNDLCSDAVSGQQFAGTGAMAKVLGSSHGARVVLPFLIPPLPGWQKATPPAMPCPTGSTDACLAARTPRQPRSRHVPCAQPW